jgi:hypothetical protein
MSTRYPAESVLADSPTNTVELEPNPAFSHSDVRFVAAFALLLCLLTSIPYWVARRTMIPGQVFTGVLVQSFDSNNYLAYSRQAADGQWLFRNPMTPEPHRPVFFNLEWLLIGKVAELLHVSLTAATDLVRLISIIGMCFAVFWIAACVLQTTLACRIALIAVMAGGGFGWIVAVHLLGVRLDSSYFLDLTNANLFPFYWALKLPHFLISETFIFLGLALFLSAERSTRLIKYVVAALCYMAAGTCRPYDMLFAMAATALYLAWSVWVHPERRSRILVRSIPITGCLPLLLYFLWIFKLHPVFRWWTIAGNPASPPWILAWSYGPSFLLLLVAAWKCRRARLTDAGMFMVCCFCTAVVLAHLHSIFHFAFQFATNILLPMIMIVLLALENSITQWKNRVGWTAVPAIVGLLLVNSLTSLSLTAQAVVLARRGEFHTDARTIAAYSWLDEHSRKNDVVFADFPLSNEIPQYTRDVVFCGYGNAVNFPEKTREVKRFLDANTPNEFREKLIRQNGVDFVFLTTSERQSVPTIAQASFLREVFSNPSITIYAVNPVPKHID